MIYLYGASGHAKVIVEILELSDKKISGLIDINPEIRTLLGYPVFQKLPDGFDVDQDFFLISIASLNLLIFLSINCVKSPILVIFELIKLSIFKLFSNIVDKYNSSFVL